MVKSILAQKGTHVPENEEIRCIILFLSAVYGWLDCGPVESVGGLQSIFPY